MYPPYIASHESVHLAWRDLLHQIRSIGDSIPGTTDALSIGSKFGKEPRDYYELVGASVTIEDPRDRLVKSQARPISPAFLLANFIFALSGFDSLSVINHYNSRGTNFSDDGLTLPNAIGKRLSGLESIDQFSACKTLLARDPSSRRAVISLYSDNDAGSPSRDCPCILHLQFMVRNNSLVCIAGVRSQSAAMLFPYDAFLLSMLQESLAVSLDLDPGRLIFHFGSLHYYHDEMHLVDAILNEPGDAPPSMPPMQQAASEVLPHLLLAEASIRQSEPRPAAPDLDQYWQVYLDTLQFAMESAHAQRSHSPSQRVATSCFSCLF